MALVWNWKDKMGKMTIIQNDKKFTLNIYEGNCLAVFLYEWENEKGEDVYQVQDFFADTRHCTNIIKNRGGHLFSDKVASIELNLKFGNANKLLNILVKNGYKVKCYYK